MAHTDTPPHDNGATGAGGKNIPPDLAEAIAVGYEPHDIGLRGVFIFLISLIGVTVAVLGVMWFTMMAFVNYDRKGDPIPSPVSIEQAAAPQPLQPSWNHPTTDAQDMLAMRTETQDILSHGGTTATGRRRIPIDEAMDKVLPQLPVRSAQHTSGDAPTDAVGSAAGGVSP